MFEGFRLSTIDTAQASIRVRHGGSGLLLHGILNVRSAHCGYIRANERHSS